MSPFSAPIPPTINDLTPAQRVRLMRSTRKLSEMLGAIPVIDSQPSSSSSSPASTGLQHTTSLRLSQKKNKKLPRPLVLSMQSVPATRSNHRSASISHSPTAAVSTPLSPTTISTNMARSASSSTLPESDSLQTRRKRMAKLARTFGENIPPELVFPPSSYRERPSPPRRNSIDSLAAFHVTVMRPHDGAEANADAVTTEPVVKPKRSMSMLRKHAHLAPVTRSASLQTPPSPIHPSSRNVRHGHASSLGMTGLHLLDKEESLEAPNTLQQMDVAPSARSSLESDGNGESKRTYRKEAGWSGEWNREDMADVMNRLRGLKAS